MHDDTACSDSRLDLLTGPDVAELLDAALTPAGASLRHWRLRDVEHRPQDRTTATYSATVAWPDGESEETLGATVSATPPESGPTVTDGDRHVQVWRFPFDPELPGLAAACFPSTVAAMLGAIDADGVGEPRLQVVSYRPRKRAVVEVTSGARRLYLKVVRPRAVADMDRRHRLLTAAGLPVPRILGHSADGVVALEALAGTTLTAALASSARSVPPVGARDVLGLLDRLPPEVAELPRRTPWPAHATHYAGVVAAACPELRSRTTALADGIGALLTGDDGGDEPTHGDFYADQLLVGGGRLTGLLDIDTLGPGRRADDLACLLAHLDLQAADDPSGGARAALTAWLPDLERRVDRRDLAARTAGVLLSLATGPYRAQEAGWQAATAARVTLAERWLETASTAR